MAHEKSNSMILFSFLLVFLTLNFRQLFYDHAETSRNRDVMIFRCFIPYVNWLPEGANSVIFPKIYCFTV